MFHALDYFYLISRFEVELVCARVKALLLETVSEVACDFWSRVLREIHNSLDYTLGSCQFTILDGIHGDLYQEVIY